MISVDRTEVFTYTGAYFKLFNPRFLFYFLINDTGTCQYGIWLLGSLSFITTGRFIDLNTGESLITNASPQDLILRNDSLYDLIMRILLTYKIDSIGEYLPAVPHGQ